MFEPEPEPFPEPEPEEDILELTDDMVAEEEPSFMDEIPEVREPTPRMTMPDFDLHEPEPPRHEEEEDAESILSAPVQVATTTALAELSRAVSRDRGVGIGRAGVTLEDVTKEILKPLIKDWLDQNLPYMIERIVKKEIEKMVNRAEKL